MMAEKTARFVRKVGPAENWGKDARLYKLSEPAPVRTIFSPGHPNSTTLYVVVSSTPENRQGVPETQVFMADADGRCPFLSMLTQAKVPKEGAFTEALQQFGFTLINEPITNESNH